MAPKWGLVDSGRGQAWTEVVGAGLGGPGRDTLSFSLNVTLLLLPKRVYVSSHSSSLETHMIDITAKGV